MTQQRVVLVTGASGGIGRATAEHLTEKGYRVFAAARSLGKLDEMRSDNLESVELDVASGESVDRAVGKVMGQAGRIDAVVNNAGYGQYGPVEDVEEEVAWRQFEVNVFGLARVTREVLPIMRDQGSGRVVNVSSAAGKLSTPFAGWYAASKHAVEALSDALRLEARPFGVGVVLIEPGAIKTGFDGVALDELWEATKTDVYRRPAEAFGEAIANAYSGAAGPEIVAKAIQRAIAARRPRARYAVGLDAKTFILMRRLLGDGLLDRLLESQLLGDSAKNRHAWRPQEA